jgi:hypothetical protein
MTHSQRFNKPVVPPYNSAASLAVLYHQHLIINRQKHDVTFWSDFGIIAHTQWVLLTQLGQTHCPCLHAARNCLAFRMDARERRTHGTDVQRRCNFARAGHEKSAKGYASFFSHTSLLVLYVYINYTFRKMRRMLKLTVSVLFRRQYIVRKGCTVRGGPVCEMDGCGALAFSHFTNNAHAGEQEMDTW